MHNKKINNIKGRSSIQGLRPFSNTIPHGLKKILKKGGYNFTSVVDNWNKMVDKEISVSCYPSNIKVGKDASNGTLILNVEHGKELEVEYGKKNIIDNINSFFGYNFISEVKLNIIQNKKITKNNNVIKKPENKKFQEKLQNIENNELKSSLKQFIKAYNDKNN